MTQLNIHIKSKDKKKIQEFLASEGKLSMSEFIRRTISEKLKIEDTAKNVEIATELPEYIPENKYIAIIKNSVVAVGDSPSEVSQIAVEKFPDLSITIKYTGPKKIQPPEYIFMSLTELNCWKYITLEEKTYPTIPIIIESSKSKKNMRALLDSAASLCVLKENFFSETEFQQVRKEQIYTAAGEITTNIYSGVLQLLDNRFETEFIIAPISDLLPFHFLIGQNLMQQLDAYFFGKKQIVCVKKAE